MTDFLNLPNWKTISVNGDSEIEYHVHAEPVSSNPICPNCGNFTEQRKFGTFSQTFLDLPSHGKRVGIFVNRQRFQCQKCNKTYSQKLYGISENHNATQRLIDYIGETSLKRTFADLAAETGYTLRQVKNLFHEYAEIQEKKFIFETPEFLGLDEVFLVGKPRGVMTNIGERTIFDLLENRNKATIKNRLMKLVDYKKIELVAIDMWNPYRDAVKDCLPKAEILIDKFHVVKMANEALDKIRKNLRASLTEHQQRKLKKDRYLLLKRPDELTELERTTLHAYLSSYLILREAYQSKEHFFFIYNSESEAEAREVYQMWLDNLTPDIEPFFADLVCAIKNWDKEIFNYFKYLRFTNAYTESLNGIIKITNRMGRGYSFDVLRAKILFSKNTHKIKPANFNHAALRESFNISRMELPEPDTNFGASISTILSKLNLDEF